MAIKKICLTLVILVLALGCLSIVGCSPLSNDNGSYNEWEMGDNVDAYPDADEGIYEDGDEGEDEDGGDEGDDD